MTFRQRALGVLAILGLGAIVIGLPMLLVALGADPLPRAIPTWDQVRSALLSPDDGTLALTALKGLGWVIWALLTGAIIIEVVDQVRGFQAPSLPGLRLPRVGVHGIVATALALFMVVPGITPSPATATPQPVAASTAWAAPTSTIAADTSQFSATSLAQSRDHTAAVDKSDEAPTVTHLTQRGDTLWGLAEHYLGDGHRYPEIAHANPDLIGDPDVLDVGWRLNIGHAQEGAPEAAEVYTVQRGDTLSGIAKSELGDANRYGDIAEASAGVTQPGGRHLHDPDLILPGWNLIIPSRSQTQDLVPAKATSSVGPDLQEELRLADDIAERVASSLPGVVESVTGTAAANVASVAGTHDAAATASSDADVAQVSEASDPSWVVTGLVGAGVLLAGGVAALLARNRRSQFRARRPGRTIATIDPALVPLEKTVHYQQPHAQARVESVDRVLRDLASACTKIGAPLPSVAAVQLVGQRVTVHLLEPAELQPPWVVNGDPSHWSTGLPDVADGEGGAAGDPSPYPLLVTIGEGDDGSVWLLNLEAFGTLAVTGDQTYAEDLARYLAAEVACNPWAGDVRLHCINVATETARMNPIRVHVHHDTDTAAGHVLAETIAQTDTATQQGTTTVQGRVDNQSDELWPGRVVLVGTSGSAALNHLLRVVDQHAQQSGTAVVVIHPDTHDRPDDHDYTDTALIINLTTRGRVHLPSVGLDLVAVGLTSDEAAGVAALLEQSAVEDTEPVPHDAEAGEGTWRAYTDHAGALRDEYTVARSESALADELDEPMSHDHDVAVSLLPGDDKEYVQVAATTVQDLAELAPGVTADVAQQVADADPTLDADLSAWFAPQCPLPRLALLGPVKARTRGRAVAVAKSKDYYVELLAYLSTRRNGATMEEVTAVFNNSPGTVRKHISHLRDWLGTNPRTGEHHLPDARKAPAAAQRNVGVYQVQDLLVDADLFRRLRARAQTLGPAGVEDLRVALRLVTGIPLDPDSLRPAGWSWVFEGDRLDQHLAVAVVDVAHLVATACIASGDLARARAAAEVAICASPAEEIPLLDLAAVAAAEGRSDEARRILTCDIAQRAGDDGAPADVPDRTRAVMSSRSWPVSHAS